MRLKVALYRTYAAILLEFAISAAHAAPPAAPKAYPPDDQYALSGDSQPQAGVPQGRIMDFRLQKSGVFTDADEHVGYLYIPAQYDGKRPIALMIFPDGEQFVRRDGLWRVPTVLDNLIAKEELPVMAAVFINPGMSRSGESNRSVEYDTLSADYGRFLLQELIPQVRRHVRITDEPAGRGIGGHSSSAIAAFTAAWQFPDQFSKVFSANGSFTHIRGGDQYPELVRKGIRKPIRVFLQSGAHDMVHPQWGNWARANQQMAAALQEKSYDHEFVFGDGTHLPYHAAAVFPQAMRWLWRDYSRRETVRPWTPETSIAVRYFAASQTAPQNQYIPDDREEIVWSPNRRYFFFISHYGDLEADRAVYHLEVFNVDEVERALKIASRSRTVLAPKWKVEFESKSSAEPAIRDARWEATGSAIVFLGSASGDHLQVHRLNVDSGRVEKMTDFDRTLTVFDFQSDGMVFRESMIKWTRPSGYPTQALIRDEDDRVVLPGVWGYYRSNDFVYSYVRGGEPRQIHGEFGRWWVAPDGRTAVMHELPSHEFGRLLLVELSTGRTLKVLGIPIDFPRDQLKLDDRWIPRVLRTNALWSADSKHVVLVNVIPLDTGLDEHAASIISYDIASSSAQILERVTESGDQYVSDAVMQGDIRVLRVTREKAGEAQSKSTYRLNDGVWTRQLVTGDRQSQVGDSLRVYIRQDANSPPTVLASDGMNSVELTGSDPALEGIWIAKTMPFKWTEQNGGSVVGGLSLPRSARTGSRVPLVIQAYYYDPKFFLPDGPHSASDAAQSLVARGFAVLQIEIIALDPNSMEDEGARFVRRIDSAIDALDAQGIIDPSRVGLTGFSRGGYETYYAITHPGKHRLAAVVCADSYTGSYARYLVDSASNIRRARDYEAGTGGRFWQNKSKWLEHETSFNVDKVETPVLFTEHGGGANPYSDHSLQTIGAFLLNEKPFDFIYFPQGSHQLLRPRERLASMEVVVDWMAFWLQDYEDPDPEKIDQYRRWRPMRQQLEARADTASH